MPNQVTPFCNSDPHLKLRNTLNAWAEGITQVTENTVFFTKAKSLMPFDDLAEIFGRDGYELGRVYDKKGRLTGYCARIIGSPKAPRGGSPGPGLSFQ